MSKRKLESEKNGKKIILLKAEDIMTKEVIILNVNLTVKEAAKIMSKTGTSSVVITENDKIRGILTERDILKRIVAEGKNSRKTKVKDIMSKPLVTIGPKTDLEKAARLMFEKKIKNLPVILENRLIGLINLQDICRIQPQILRLLKQVMKPPKNIQKVLRYYII